MANHKARFCNHGHDTHLLGRDKASRKCSECRRQRIERVRVKRRDALAAIKLERGCQLCGYDRNHAVLAFHHRDPETKDFQISPPGHGWERTLVEIAKCEVLCANCHLEVHYPQFSTDD